MTPAVRLSRARMLIAALAVWSLAALPQSGSAEERHQFTVPGRGWTLAIELPTLAKFQGQSEDGRFKVMSQSAEENVIMSFFVEPTTSSKDAETCRNEYWGAASRNPAILAASVTMTEIEGAPAVSYVIEADVDGQRVQAQNVNVYSFRDGTCTDLHLSVFPAEDGGVAKLASIAATASLSSTR